jgi:hypothetical protein
VIRINCSFPIYVLPKDANWAVRLLKFVSEQFGLSVLRQERVFTINTAQPDLFLRPGTVIDVDNAALGRTSPGRFRVVSGTMRICAGHTEVDLKLRELRPKPLDAWFAARSPGTQKMIAWMAGGAVACILAFGAYAVLNYPSPQVFWAWVGRNIRDIVASGLLMLCWLPYWSTMDRLESAPLVKRALFVTCAVTSVIAFITWGFSVEALPANANAEAAIRYFDDLRSKAATYIPMIAGLIPWLLIIVDRLGLSVLGGILKAIKDNAGR